ncbi:BatA domain-containing protein [Flagellimonas onchidii]|uniref:BatA domain-containing protein n=1 Tax=Flagellimonas onchidii TaxID=2562684 RepID=UPI0010A5D232|nr:BatA domain-containing protein [Allomuricauda onchidii]
MQFKHPEILWALFLLLIPILIHLFQLRRFKKTPFTNVVMLQKVVSESRKSNMLKKWLLLFTRLLLLTALVIAFAQPFIASQTALKQKETVIYLDNSFSMQAKENGLSLLEKSVQDLIKNIDKEQVLSLFTNEHTFKNITVKNIQNDLLSIPYSYKQLGLDEVKLKAGTLFSKSDGTIKNLILISDFQQRTGTHKSIQDSTIRKYFVPVFPSEVQNVSIDSIQVSDNTLNQLLLKVMLSGGSEEETVPISLYNKDTLIAKVAAKFESGDHTEVEFSIPNDEEIDGRLQIIENGGAGYDNTFYFNIGKKEKIKVLSIGETDDNYLSRLYTADEFVLTQIPLDQLDYSILNQQHTVILNNLKSIPNSLQEVLSVFKENGGTLVVIPSLESDLTSYNQFLSNFYGTQLLEASNVAKRITNISFGHPLYKNVFEQQVDNFQYPTVNHFFRIRSNLPKVLSLEGNDAFLVGNNGFYLFATSLKKENTNFKNSPLIVPTFYNMAEFSLKMNDLYYTLGNSVSVDVPVNLGSDKILNVSKLGETFIPLQQSFPNKIRLTFDDIPTSDGIFSVLKDGQSVRNISFNYPRTESKLNYMDLNGFTNVEILDSVPSLFNQLKTEDAITAYWKWFVILALFLALVEVIIQKFVK